MRTPPHVNFIMIITVLLLSLIRCIGVSYMQSKAPAAKWKRSQNKQELSAG